MRKQVVITHHVDEVPVKTYSKVYTIYEDKYGPYVKVMYNKHYIKQIHGELTINTYCKTIRGTMP